MSDLGFLALGYGLIWVIIAAYVWFIGRKQTTLSRQLEGLRMEVDEVTKRQPQE